MQTQTTQTTSITGMQVRHATRMKELQDARDAHACRETLTEATTQRQVVVKPSSRAGEVVVYSDNESWSGRYRYSWVPYGPKKTRSFYTLTEVRHGKPPAELLFGFSDTHVINTTLVK